MRLCQFPLFSKPYWSSGKSPGACPPEEATISSRMRGYRTVVWKYQRAWMMESPGNAVIFPWISSPHIYRPLISASDRDSSPFFWAFSYLCPLFPLLKLRINNQGDKIQVKDSYLFIFSSGFQRLLCNIWERVATLKVRRWKHWILKLTE